MYKAGGFDCVFDSLVFMLGKSKIINLKFFYTNIDSSSVEKRALPITPPYPTLYNLLPHPAQRVRDNFLETAIHLNKCKGNMSAIKMHCDQYFSTASRKS